ncbi:MAG: hypothetical protein Q8942_09360 [Bacillota bacterium]|nr:hypothetical protein [Bacillota bacterium]
MKKRVIAWILLIGFVVLLVDIIFLHLYMAQSLVVYAVIILLYWFVLRKDIHKTNKEIDKE